MGEYLEMSGSRYAELYKRFMEKSVDELLLIAGPVEGKRILDLCAGGCRLGIRAKELGASLVYAVDDSFKMMEEAYDREAVDVVGVCDLSKGFISRTGAAPFDMVFCQQGVNYWWNSRTVGEISGVLDDNGVFAFNTFYNPPPVEPQFKKYQFDGKWYSEMYQLVGKTVLHIQTCGDTDPHISKFRWIPKGEFMSVLEKNFHEIERFPSGNTVIYVAKNPIRRYGLTKQLGCLNCL